MEKDCLKCDARHSFHPLHSDSVWPVNEWGKTMARFEIAIFNDRVRQAVKNNDHSEYSDEWADLHFIEVSAGDEQEARRKILTKYPKEKGFIIESISPA